MNTFKKVTVSFFQSTNPLCDTVITPYIKEHIWQKNCMNIMNKVNPFEATVISKYTEKLCRRETL